MPTHYLPTMNSCARESLGWSKTAKFIFTSWTMCGIQAVKFGKPVDVGQHTDVLKEVTCEQCLSCEKNRQEVIRRGWAGKAISFS